MKIAIIDSGVEKSVFEGINIKQYRIYDGTIIEETPVDYVNHGTAMASIILSGVDVEEVISICPGIDSDGEVDELIAPYDIAVAIRLAADKGVSVINISMGTNDFVNREIIDDACQYAYEKGCTMVCGTSSDGTPSMPWASKKVIKVWHKEESGNQIEFEQIGGAWHIVVCKKMFRAKTRENAQFVGKHNSMATAWITNRILCEIASNNYSSLDNKELQNRIEEIICNKWFDKLDLTSMYEQKIEIIRNRKNIEKMALGNVCIVPFNKEMHGVVRFEEMSDYKIVAAVDSPRKGLIGKDIGELIGLRKSGIILVKDLSQVNKKVDTLIIGYLDEVEKLDSNFCMDSILGNNLNNTKANVFSFVPVSSEWIEKYERVGLQIKTAPYIGEEEFVQINEDIPYDLAISKPVIGVFGTSSSQGKFTLQVYIKECMKKKGISCTHLSTEHQGEIMGADGVLPLGYDKDSNINLPMEFQKIYIEKYMMWLNYVHNGEFILVGGQSGVIPYSINYEGFLHSAVFLEGVKPDFAILVYNPYMDDEEYVNDCMLALKSVYKCRTIAMAFSDNTKKKINGKWKNKKLDDTEKEELSKKGRETYKRSCGCITNQAYVEEICNTIIEYCS